MKYKTSDLLQYIFNFFLSLITVIGISVVLPADEYSPFQRVMPRSFLWIIIFILLWTGMNRLGKAADRRYKKYAFQTALFYSLCSAAGYFFKSWGTITAIWKNTGELMNFICFHIGFFCLSYYFLLLLFRIIGEKTERYRSLNAPAKPAVLFFCSLLLILFAWFPWFSHVFPGVLTIDSIDQLAQAIGEAELYDHHPIVHTLWIRLLYFICGKTQTTVVLYSVSQMLLSASVFSYCIMYIHRWFKRGMVSFAALLFFALYPIFPIYGMTMWKDIPFALLMLLITLNLCKFIRSDEAEQKRVLIRNAVLFLLLSFMRHNGIFVFIPTYLVLFLICKPQRKTILTAAIAVMAVFAGFQTAGLTLLHIKKGRTAEAMSIPLQQIARTAARHHDELTEEQIEAISVFFNGNDISKLYKPTLSDPVKGCFNETLFKEDPSRFVDLWRSLGKAYPKDYIESVLHNSYGYWYPEASQSAFFFGLYFGERYDLHEAPLFNSALMTGLRQFLVNMKYYSLPVISWIFAPAFAVWILFFGFQFCRLQRSKYLLIHVPLISLWLQMFGSPAFCEYRYVYGLFTCLPLVLCASLLPSEKDA